MLDLLERRNGEPPHDMAFNDIAFHLHELCSHSPEMVLRMTAHGFDELAAMTATEDRMPTTVDIERLGNVLRAVSELI
jgi:hypothetical protein